MHRMMGNRPNEALSALVYDAFESRIHSCLIHESGREEGIAMKHLEK